MGNVPFYEEVVEFAKGIVDELNRRRTESDDLPEYAIAAEHAHRYLIRRNSLTDRSCCILIARTTLRRDDKWYTHIDYPRFFELLESGEPFTPLEYIAETPAWAYFGNGGFNPEDVRVKRNKKADKEKEETALRGEFEQIGGRIGKVIEGEDIDVVLDGGCGG
jgi:tRNA wybutosine-synthesizing protein 1